MNLRRLAALKQTYEHYLDKCQNEASVTFKDFRERNGWSLRQLAIMLDCDHSYISKIENGHEKASPAILIKLLELKEK